jgi:hypothetical protein
MNVTRERLRVPAVGPTRLPCTACGRYLSVVVPLGRADQAFLTCDGCGRRGVSCSCPALGVGHLNPIGG